MMHLVSLPDALSPSAVLRLRVAAVLAVVLPLGSLVHGRHRPASFLLDRSREMALLVGGALAALTLATAYCVPS